MDLLTILITGVGSGVAKGILNLWIEEPFSKEIGKNFVSIIASKTKDDIIAQNKGRRQFEEISEKVAQNLIPLFENAEGISQKRKQEIAQLAGVAVNNLKISTELLIQEDLDSKQIEKLLLHEAYFPNEENPRINFTEKEEKLYKRVMAASAEYIVSTASTLPKFQENAIAEILKRENSVSAIAIETLEEIRRISKHLESSNEQDREFEKRYRNAVILNLDKLFLFGVKLSDSSKRYKLSVAYVTLLVEYSGFIDNDELDSPSDDMPDREYEGEQILSIDEAISKSKRLLLRGPTGSGKTTLMKWVAVMSAGSNLKKELNDWNECVPFFIRLRNFSDADLPSPKNFPSLTAKSLSDEMPEKWVAEKLKAGKAIILVDGIDEIAENHREKVKD